MKMEWAGFQEKMDFLNIIKCNQPITSRLLLELIGTVIKKPRMGVFEWSKWSNFWVFLAVLGLIFDFFWPFWVLFGSNLGLI